LDKQLCWDKKSPNLFVFHYLYAFYSDCGVCLGTLYYNQTTAKRFADLPLTQPIQAHYVGRPSVRPSPYVAANFFVFHDACRVSGLCANGQFLCWKNNNGTV
jgi:hypothetical protein